MFLRLLGWSAVGAVLIVGSRWRRRIDPDIEKKLTVAQAEHQLEVSRMGKRFKLHACYYCGNTFRTAEEVVAHWLKFKGKCSAVPNAENPSSETTTR